MLSLKNLAKLKQKKYRREFGCFVVEGKRAVQDALDSSAEIVQLVCTDKFRLEHADFYRQPAVQAHVKAGTLTTVSPFVFTGLTDTVTPQGIAAVVNQPTYLFSLLESGTTIAILEDIRDPGNLGTMIRTADWFGLDGILLVGGIDPYQPKVVRASMGSLFHLPLVHSQDLNTELQQLKQAGFTLIVTRPELAGAEPTKLTAAPKTCLIFGSEAHGTSALIDNLADQSWSIPQFGAAESLNVAVSLGITLYELKSREVAIH